MGLGCVKTFRHLCLVHLVNSQKSEHDSIIAGNDASRRARRIKHRIEAKLESEHD
jgi:hypothetical protein